MFIHPHVKFRFVMHSYPLLYTFCLYYYFSLSVSFSRARSRSYSPFLSVARLLLALSLARVQGVLFKPKIFSLLFVASAFFLWLLSFLYDTHSGKYINKFVVYNMTILSLSNELLSLSLLPLLRLLLNIVTKYNIAAERKGQRERMFFSVSRRVRSLISHRCINNVRALGFSETPIELELNWCLFYHFWQTSGADELLYSLLEDALIQNDDGRW